MCLVCPFEVFSCNGVGENEKLGPIAARFPQTLQQQIILVVQHQTQSFLRDVSRGFSVDLVTEFHVIGRDRLRDRARCAPCLEEVPSDFLTGTDLCERAVLSLIEVDRQSFPIGR